VTKEVLDEMDHPELLALQDLREMQALTDVLD